MRWKKTSDDHLEGYLGKYHVVSLFKEGEVFKWYCELPFGTELYMGREHGSTSSPKKAMADATKKVNEWLKGAELI